jgi:hypothetical protein
VVRKTEMDIHRFNDIANKIEFVMNKKVAKREIKSYIMDKNADDRVLIFEIEDFDGKVHFWDIGLSTHQLKLEKTCR